MITHEIIVEDRLVIVTAFGLISPVEISADQGAIRADPAFDPSFSLLIDFSKASFAALNAASARQHAEEDPFGPGTPRAIVVGKESDASMVRLFEVISRNVSALGPVEAFTDRQKALEWLMQLRSAAPDTADASVDPRIKSGGDGL